MGFYDISAVAKHINGLVPVKVSLPILMDFLRREVGALYMHRSEAKQTVIDAGYMDNRMNPVQRTRGTVMEPTPKFTKAGVAWITDKYIKWLAADYSDDITAGMEPRQIIVFRREQFREALRAGMNYRKAFGKFSLLLSRNPETDGYPGLREVNEALDSGRLADGTMLLQALDTL